MGFHLHRLASAAAANKTLALAAAVAAVATAAAAAAALTSPPPLSPAPAPPTNKTLLSPARHHSTTTAAAASADDPSPWVILGSIPRVCAASSSAAADVSLSLTAPPRVSHLTISPRVFPARTTPQHFPFVLAAADADPSSSGLLLLSATLSAPLTRVAHGGGTDDPPDSVCWRDDDPRYFVLDAATGSATRLPDPAPNSPVEHQALLGILSHPTDSGDPNHRGGYLVAELLPLIGSDTAYLQCYSSATGAWVTKTIRYPLPPRVLAPICTLALHGRLWWADYSWGVLTADPFADHPVLRFVPLPGPSGVLRSREGWGVLDRFRYVGASAGKLRFVDMYDRRRGGGAAGKVSVWTLPHPDATEWVLEHEAAFADVWADETYKATGLPEKAPVLALIHPQNPAVVYFFLEDHMFAVDVPARKVVECDRYQLVAPPREYVANRFVRAWELPRVVSSGNWASDIGLTEPPSRRSSDELRSKEFEVQG